jgi:hypothetical protein
MKPLHSKLCHLLGKCNITQTIFLALLYSQATKMPPKKDEPKVPKVKGIMRGEKPKKDPPVLTPFEIALISASDLIESGELVPDSIRFTAAYALAKSSSVFFKNRKTRATKGNPYSENLDTSKLPISERMKVIEFLGAVNSAVKDPNSVGVAMAKHIMTNMETEIKAVAAVVGAKKQTTSVAAELVTANAEKEKLVSTTETLQSALKATNIKSSQTRHTLTAEIKHLKKPMEVTETELRPGEPDLPAEDMADRAQRRAELGTLIEPDAAVIQQADAAVIQQAVAALPMSSFERAQLFNTASAAFSLASGTDLYTNAITANALNVLYDYVPSWTTTLEAVVSRDISGTAGSILTAMKAMGLVKGAIVGASAYTVYTQVQRLYAWATSDEAKEALGEETAARMAYEAAATAEILKSQREVSPSFSGGGSNSQQAIDQAYINYVTRNPRMPKKVNRMDAVSSRSSISVMY